MKMKIKILNTENQQEEIKEIKESTTEGHENPEPMSDDKIQDVTNENEVQEQLNEEIQQSKKRRKVTSEDVIQEPIKEEFQESTSEEENKDSEYWESTREELQELCTTDDEDLHDKASTSEDEKQDSSEIDESVSFTNSEPTTDNEIDEAKESNRPQVRIHEIYSQDSSYAASTEKTHDKASTSEDEIQESCDESVWFAPSEPTTNNEIEGLKRVSKNQKVNMKTKN
ncbi:hypothetical protein CDAR_189831 [Caerostris darwini]|uniref:Uncharacterized protein n=1 Tax=Caerostris darwini TaxID=1538125 RepID=A0AAV4VK25_9ARAC|nr:hypothetical protein CDAR_189831 [Caerostris darwini]